MEEPSARDDRLDDDGRDRLVAVGKAVVSLLPWLGGPLAEIIGYTIPAQRADRLADYARKLSERIDGLEAQIGSKLPDSPLKVDLIEEGAYQAARAVTPERIGMIVEAVVRGLSEDEAALARRKRLLLLAGELDDDELAVLNAYGRSYGSGIRGAFDAIGRPPPVHLQSSREEFEAKSLYDAGTAHLLRLDLLKRNHGSVKRGELPEWDSSKKDFKHTVEISGLGRMLLKEIGLETPFDARRSS